MKTTVELGELPGRLSEVLLAVLRGYVETGQPIGSRDALGRGELEVSSATVRGAMAELMELGLLEQPHTSAGRVPTDAAFRLWVDHLLHEPQAEQRMPVRLARELAESASGLAPPLQRAADVLTEVTGQLGFSLAREREGLRLVQVHFARVSSDRVTALLVSERGSVRTRIFEERESDQRRLDRISAELSELVAGLTLEEARARLTPRSKATGAGATRSGARHWRSARAGSMSTSRPPASSSSATAVACSTSPSSRTPSGCARCCARSTRSSACWRCWTS